jgi:hypothetical protein
VKAIGTDEFCFNAGTLYIIVVANLPTGRVLAEVEGKNEEDIQMFLNTLPEKRKGSKL